MGENDVSNKIIAENLTSDQKREIQRKRFEEGSKREEMIASEDGVIDVVDLINNSESPAIAIRVSLLLENGVTENMIKSKYMDMSSGVSDKSVALENLRKVCDHYIRYVSEQANGVVIDPVTLKKDPQKSLKQMVDLGIVSKKDVILIDPTKMAFEDHKQKNIMEILKSTSFFSEAEKEDLYWDFNKNIYDYMKNYGGYINPKNEKRAKELIEQAYGNSENVFTKTSLGELDFIIKGYYFSKKDFDLKEGALNSHFEKYKDQDGYSQILNENGNVDKNKIREYIEKWTKEKNAANLKNDTTKFLWVVGVTEAKIDDLDEVNKEFLKSILARGYFSEGENKDAFNLLCKELGIETSLESILEVTGCKTINQLEAIKNKNEINENTYTTILYDEKRKQKMSPVEKMIFELTEDLNLHRGEEKEAVARLFVSFEEKRKAEPNDSRNQKMYQEVVNAIQYYMISNKEYFSEYMILERNDGATAKNKLTPERVKKILEGKEEERRTQNQELQGKNTRSLMNSLPKKIEFALDKFRVKDEKYLTPEEEAELVKYFTMNEEILVDYEEEKKLRAEAKKNKTIEFMADDKSDTEKSKLYKTDSVEDINFATAMIYHCRKIDDGVNQEQLNRSLFQYRKSKYYSILLDEKGNIDTGKLEEFKNRWIDEHNKSALKEDLVEYLLFARDKNVVFEDLDEVNKANLRSILARGFLTEDRRNKLGFTKLCEYLNIGDDLESILKATGCSSLEKLEMVKNDYELNDKNYRYHLYEAKDKSVMSKSDKMLFELTENLDLRNEEARDAVAQLYLTYAEKVMSNPDGTYESNLGKEMSLSIGKYMLANRAYFSEYLTTISYSGNIIKNKLDGANVRKVLEQKDISAKSKAYAGKMNERINGVLSKLDNVNGQLTSEAFSNFFGNKSEGLANEYKNESIDRLKEKNKELKPKKKENKVVSWIKEKATSIKERFQGMMEKRKASKLDSKEIKLLEEPKEKIQTDRRNDTNILNQTYAIDHAKALEELRESEEKSVDVSKEM